AAQGTESATSVPVAVREHVTGPRSSEKLQRSVTAIPPAPAGSVPLSVREKSKSWSPFDTPQQLPVASVKPEGETAPPSSKGRVRRRGRAGCRAAKAGTASVRMLLGQGGSV